MAKSALFASAARSSYETHRWTTRDGFVIIDEAADPGVRRRILGYRGVGLSSSASCWDRESRHARF